jgi:hypothetical protein
MKTAAGNETTASFHGGLVLRLLFDEKMKMIDVSARLVQKENPAHQ